MCIHPESDRSYDDDQYLRIRRRVNGIKLYYEIDGSGAQPLVMLHGGLGSVAMFGPNVAALARHRQVIAVDLYGHGHTAFVDGRGLLAEQMADDMLR